MGHDPKKCPAVFRQDHAQTTTYSATTICSRSIALQNLRATVVGFGRRLNWKARAQVHKKIDCKKEGRPEAAFATLSCQDGL
jgi:hypothetical protein